MLTVIKSHLHRVVRSLMGRDLPSDPLPNSPEAEHKARITLRFSDGRFCAPSSSAADPLQIATPWISRIAGWSECYYEFIAAALQRHELTSLTYDWHGNWRDPFNKLMTAIIIAVFHHGIVQHVFEEDLSAIPHTYIMLESLLCRHFAYLQRQYKRSQYDPAAQSRDCKHSSNRKNQNAVN